MELGRKYNILHLTYLSSFLTLLIAFLIYFPAQQEERILVYKERILCRQEIRFNASVNIFLSCINNGS